MTMLWGRTGQKGFPRERLGRRPAVLGFYAWQYSGCPMKAGNLSESEGSDAFWVPLYSSIYLRESHVQGNRFDLENPGWYVLEGAGTVWRCPPDAAPESVSPVEVAPGDALVIPTGWRFQFSARSDGILRFLCHTTPPWPGDDEAVPAERGGLGEATV